MQPARQLAQLRARGPRLLGGVAQVLDRLLGSVLGELALGDRQPVAEHDQPLLRAVVQVAADATALLVGDGDEPHARGGDLGLVAAALELGARPRGEDAQDRDRLLARLEPPRGHHGEVPDALATGAAHDDREVAVERVTRHVAVVRERRQRAHRELDHVALVRERAGRARDRERVALRQLAGVGPGGGEDGGGLVALGDEHDVGAERLDDVVGERAQERGADVGGGSGGDQMQQLGRRAAVVRDWEHPGNCSLRAMNVGVVGCGTGGPAAAVLLARQGHRVEVFEQEPSPGPVGAGLLLQPTGMAVLERLGVLERVRACADPVRRIHGARSPGAP